jgi:hypothetical protein
MAIGNSFATDRAANTFDNAEFSAMARSPLTTDLPKKASSYAIATSGTFTDNGSSNFAGDLSNPFDDAQLYANGVTINGIPTFSGFGAAIAVGPGAVVPDAVRQRWTVENLSQAVAIDVPAYVVPTLPGSDYIVDVRSLLLNNAADVVRVFGDGGLPSIVYFTGGSLALPDQVNLKNVTIVVESGDLNFNGDRHLLENVTIVVKDGSVNLGDVRAVNSSVYSAGAIHMNQGARFSGKNFLGTQNGDVIFNGATETIDPKDFVKVVAHGDIFLNAGADVRGEFWSSEDFFANGGSTIFGSVRAQQSITFNAQVQVISDILQNTNFPLKNQPAIAVIDTGFAKNNPDINYQRLISLVDRVGGDSDPFLAIGEGNQHGTHTLGIIAATQGNNLGIDGVNANAPIYVARAVGSGQWAESIVEFLDQYETDSNQPNPIIYLGFDLTQQNTDGSMTTRYELTVDERSVLEYARQKGALIVVPAGNDGGVMSALGQAAQEFDNIVTVGALDGAGRAPYSSYGDGLTIMAPGGTVDQPIASTVGDGLGTMAGTSTAAAYAVGYIANIWAANPELSYKQVINILKETARDINLPGWDAETGFGILDIAPAIELAQQTEPEIYDPPATIVPDSWSGAGIVQPLERPVGSETLVNFGGKVFNKVTAGVLLRSGPGGSYASVGSIPSKQYPSLSFDAWTRGEMVDYSNALGRKGDRWYRISSDTAMPAEYRGKWVSETLIDGQPPIFEGPKQPVTVPIVTGSPNYLDGRINPFAYRWIGQCTWYAYGRMLETGLLPVGAKANGWFLSNAEAWRRDALRADLKVNSQPTERGLVVWPPGVQGGDRLYGHVAFVEEVFADGRIRISESNWNGKQVGERILTPAQYRGLAFIPLENVAANPQFTSPSAKSGQQREYRVLRGDTLSGIALRELGNANRWREITNANGKTFTEEEARKLQIGQSVYLPVKIDSKGNTPVIKAPGNGSETQPSFDSTKTTTQQILPNQMSSNINFGLKNQSIWSGGQGAVIGGAITNKFEPEFEFGLAKFKFDAGYNLEAFVSAGTFNMNIPSVFNIDWSLDSDRKSVAINFKHTMNSGLELETLLGLGLSAKANLGANVTVSLPVPFVNPDNYPKYTTGVEVSGGFDLQGAMKAANSPVVLDLGLNARQKNSELDKTSIEAKDDAFQALDILNTLALPGLPTSAAAIPIRDAGFLSAQLGVNVQQKSQFELLGFEIDYDDQKNDNEILVKPNESGMLIIPILKALQPGEIFKVAPTVKPIVNFQSIFNLNGKLEASLDSKKLFETSINKLPLVPDWLKDQIKEGLPGFSLKKSLETPSFTVWKGKQFNPFDFTNVSRIGDIKVQAT